MSCGLEVLEPSIRIYGYRPNVKYFGLIIPLYTYIRKPMKQKSKFTTTLNTALLKDLKKLAIDLDRTVNDLLEEGIKYLLKKHGKKAAK